jgi:hypothetical protein
MIMGKASRLVLLAAATILGTGASSAQIYRCVQDGRTSFQETPCDAGGAQSRLAATPRTRGWEGCYIGDFGKWGGGRGTPLPMQIRRSGDTLVAALGDGPQGDLPDTMPVRPYTAQELAREQTSLGGTRNPAPVLDALGWVMPADRGDASKGSQLVPFLYWTLDDDGSEVLVGILPFTGGFVFKIRCGAQPVRCAQRGQKRITYRADACAADEWVDDSEQWAKWEGCYEPEAWDASKSRQLLVRIRQDGHGPELVSTGEPRPLLLRLLSEGDRRAASARLPDGTPVAIRDGVAITLPQEPAEPGKRTRVEPVLYRANVSGRDVLVASLPTTGRTFVRKIGCPRH